MNETIKRIQVEIEHTKKLGFKRVKLDIVDVEALIENSNPSCKHDWKYGTYRVLFVVTEARQCKLCGQKQFKALHGENKGEWCDGE